MNRVALSSIRLEDTRFTGWARALRRVLFALFLIQFALVWARLWQPSFLFGNARWPDGVLLILAAATTLASLAGRLPGQNVMLASILIAVMGGAAGSLNGLTGMPFGPCAYTERIGQQLFHPLPWAVPVLWLVAILNSRGAAQLVLRPWRSTPAYGFWLLGITVLLTVGLDAGLEPFATQVRHYWAWGPTRLKCDWYGAPLVNFIGWAGTAAVSLAFATPSLINKKPARHSLRLQPLVVWLLVNGLFLTGAALRQLWPAVGLTGTLSLIVAALALHGRQAMKGGRGGRTALTPVPPAG